MLSMLIPGTTPKMCHTRGKVLGLKKLSAEEAKLKSVNLHTQVDVPSHIVEKKVFMTLQKFVLGKLEEDKDASRSDIRKYLDYISNVCHEYTEFRKKQDDMVLFGDELELADIKRAVQQTSKSATLSARNMQIPFTIVPLTRNDFRKLSDPLFLHLLTCFGVCISPGNNVFPRVDSNVQADKFKQTLDMMYVTLDKMAPTDLLDSEAIKDLSVFEK